MSSLHTTVFAAGSASAACCRTTYCLDTNMRQPDPLVSLLMRWFRIQLELQRARSTGWDEDGWKFEGVGGEPQGLAGGDSPAASSRRQHARLNKARLLGPATFFVRAVPTCSAT